MRGQDLCMFYVSQDVWAHTCRCIRECICIFTYTGMCVCAQACACMVDYCISPVSLLMGMQMQILCKCRLSQSRFPPQPWPPLTQAGGPAGASGAAKPSNALTPRHPQQRTTTPLPWEKGPRQGLPVFQFPSLLRPSV